jgi:hypothetical protein
VLSSVVAEDGRIAWLKTTHADEAYRKTVAMSQMASMLKDRARNEAYAAAITKCVAQFSAEHGRPPVVLDVGAGTGLLSLLSARAGAAAVHGVEQWAVMAGIAQKVVACNPPLDAAVRIHATHSSALAVAPAPSLAPAVRKLGGAAPLRSSPLAPKPAAAAGAGAPNAHAAAAAGAACGDAYTIPAHADVVVSEILDSALLGEGVIPSLSHAFAELMRAAQAPQTAGAPCAAAAAAAHGASGTPPCVPLSATVYAQLVHSPQFGAWQDTTDTSIPVPGPPTAAAPTVASDAATASAEAAHGLGASARPDSGAAAACAPLLMSRRDWQPACHAQPVAVPIHVRLLTPAPVAVSPVFTACEILFTPEGVRAVSQPHAEGSAAAAAAPAAAPPSRAEGSPAAPSPQRQILTVPALAREPSAAEPAPTANALLFWWRAVLWRGSAGPSSDVVYCTCAGCVEAQGWQDHWVQCVLPLARPVAASAAVAGAQQHPDIPPRTAAPCFAPAARSVTVSAASGGPVEAYPVGLCPSAMACAAAPAIAAPAEPHAPSFAFTLTVDLSPMAVQFQVGPGDAEVWPAKRLRNRAVKEGRALKLAPGAPLMCVDEPEPCTCGLHSLYSVDRRWALNDRQRWDAFSAGLQQALRMAVRAAAPAAVSAPFTAISLGDGAVAGLAVAAALEEAGTEFGLPAPATGDAGAKVEADAAADASDGTHSHGREAGSGDDEDGDVDEDGAEETPSTFRVLAVEDSRLAAVHTEALARARGLPEDAFSAVVAPALEGAPASVTEPAAAAPAAAAAGAGAEQAALPATDGDRGLAALLQEVHAAAADSPAGVSDGPFAHLLVLEPVFARMQTHPLWCAVSAWRRCAALAPLLYPSAVVFPGRARVCAQAVWFAHLADNHGTVGAVCGFDHGPFDAVEAGWHRHTYTYPLHQYGWAPASAPATEWAPLSFAAPTAAGREKTGDLSFSTTLTLRADNDSAEASAAGVPPCAHGVMFWVEYDAQSGSTHAAKGAHVAAPAAASPVLTTHPTVAPHQRQHVRFFERPVPLARGAVPASVSVRLHITRVAEGGAGASSGAAFTFDLDAQPVP